MKYSKTNRGQKRQQALPRLFTKMELAEFLSLSPRTIEGLMKQGLPHIKLKRAARFDVDDVMRFLKSRNQVGAFYREVQS